MFDDEQAQKDLTQILLSAEQLEMAGIVYYRERQTEEEVYFKTALARGRNGRVGCVIATLIPDATAGHRNVTGPILDWNFPVVVIVQQDINLSAFGTRITASGWAQRVMDVLHMEADVRFGTWSVTGRAMQSDERMVFPGCVGYRVTLSMSAGKNTQTTRCGMVQISVVTGLCTLSCATEGARIRYSVGDGTVFPSDDRAANPGVQKYEDTGPFPVQAGEIIRAAAYANGKNKGATAYYTVAS